MLPSSVNLNELPEKNTSRRTFFPLGEIGQLPYIRDEFSEQELNVIKNTPFLASRLEAAAEKGNIIGYRDTYKNNAAKLEARQAYNFAVNNPKEFLKSEFPAYLGSGNVSAITQIVGELNKLGETPQTLTSLYESSLPEAPNYTQTYSEFREINKATQGADGGPLGKYIQPIMTTIATIALGPPGAAFANAVFQLGETGKIDPEKVAVAAAKAYVAQETIGAIKGTPAEAGGLPSDYDVDPFGPGGEITPDTGGFPPNYNVEPYGPGGIVPPQPVDMGLGSGIKTTLPPLPDANLLGTTTTPDYRLEPQTIPGSDGGQVLKLPTMPSVSGLGGAQGITVPIPGGTVGQFGVTPTGATPVLGSPGSFINDPNVLGTDVIGQGTPSTISPRDAFRAARLANSLLNPPEAGGAGGGVAQDSAQQTMAGVDYSGLYNLLAQRALAGGLLGTRYQPQSINLASLLG